MKYIIKNCGCNPACDECYIRCKDITDCVLKKIVALCDAYDDSNGLPEEILDLLEIEECE